jgi:hypothetical protein
VFELVSPVYKGGYGASRIEAVAPDGESVAYYSQGDFAGTPRPSVGETTIGGLGYLARRSSSEWSTVPLTVPLTLIARTFPADISPSLDRVLAMGAPGPNSQNLLPRTDLLLHSTGLPDTVAGWEPFGGLETPEIKYVDSSAGFCNVLFYSTSKHALVPEAEDGQIYELDRGCGGEPGSLSIVGVNNRDKLIHRGCEVEAGIADYAPPGMSSTFNAISTDGGEVFFTDCLSGRTDPASPHQLFARVGGSRTLEVSRPLVPACGEVPCSGASSRASADFAGASEDGSRVFFTAPLAAGQQPLVPGDADASNNLYMATVGCPEGGLECQASGRVVTSLIQASHDLTGGAAEVRGVVRVAPDGVRVYFVAGGDLLSQVQRQVLEGEGRPVPRVGAENLYVYDSVSGSVGFIGDLCSGRELSGSVGDIRCPSETGTDGQLWSSNRAEAQTAGPDGRFLVFATYAELTGDDTNTASDVYRFDAETGVLERVSIGEDGYDANGNGGVLGATITPGNHGNGLTPFSGLRSQHELDNRAVSEDGSRIVFTSAELLSPAVSNGLLNAYEWHEGPGGGDVSLVSTGSDEQPVYDVVISPNGSSVFFVTVQGLVSQDTDGLLDVYDARLEEGFGQPAAERRPCKGDACQGPLTNPAPLLIPGSVPQAPGGNWPVPKQPAVTGSKKKAKAKRKARAKRARGKRRGKSSARSAGRTAGASGGSGR